MQLVSASVIGVNRAELSFSDVLRNGYAEQEFVVSMGTDYDIQVFYEARGEIADWIRFEPDSERVIVNQDSPQTIKVIVEPPSDARVESYEGSIVVLTGPLGEASGNMGTNVVAAFEIKVVVDITDTQILSCSVGGMNILDSEQGFPLTFSSTLRNTGNVRVRPSFNIEVFDQLEQEQVLTSRFVSNSDIVPTGSANIAGDLELDLAPGQYWARITEDVCDGSSYITFSVLETGAIRDVGEFIRIQNDAWSESGDIVPLNVFFRNRGERVVSAQFKGTVSKDGKIVEILESDVINVDPDQLIQINMFYTPQEYGQYEIKGRIHYNNKISFERGSVLNVQPSSGINTGFSFLSAVFYTAIISSVVLLFLILRKKKKKY